MAPPAEGGGPAPWRHLLGAPALAPAVMLALVLLVFVRVWWPAEGALLGTDYEGLHVHRLLYAREQLAHGVLPAWSPREGLGAPFWSNPQSLTLLPVRWPLLLLDAERHAFPAGVVIAALGAALSCFLFGRRLGLSAPAAAVAGWTFASSGFFASRVLVGHLPLLEAYPALPLLLWLVELAVAAEEGEGRTSSRHLALAVAAGSVALAGHPQLSTYSLALAAAYAAWRGRDRVVRVRTLASIALGVVACGAALVPTALLASRSTRSLSDLAPPANDVAFGWQQVLLAVHPWGAGFSAPHPLAEQSQVGDLARHVFFDSVCYVGLLPLGAAVALGVAAVARRRVTPDRRWWFVAAAASLALVLALDGPWRDGGGGQLLFKSPTRWLYVTGLGLALALGAFVDRAGRRLGPGVVAALVALHAVDLGSYSRTFIVLGPPAMVLSESLTRAVGDGRIAAPLEARGRHRVDDVGIFDSLLLAVPYQALAAVSRWPVGTNMQYVPGNSLPERTLRWAAVRLVVGDFDRPGVTEVVGASPRASLHPAELVVRVPLEEARRRLASDEHDLVNQVLVSAPDGSAAAPTTPAARDGRARAVPVGRPRPDVIECRVDASTAGVLRTVEAWDPGWSASVDGRPAPVLVADGGLLAVEVPAGARDVRLVFTTPGAGAGLVVSLAALLGLAVHLRRASDRERR